MSNIIQLDDWKNRSLIRSFRETLEALAIDTMQLDDATLHQLLIATSQSNAFQNLTAAQATEQLRYLVADIQTKIQTNIEQTTKSTQDSPSLEPS